MKDYLGNELNVGDKVIFVEPGYRNFAKGTIVKITAKYCFIEYKKYYTLDGTFKRGIS